MILTISQQKSEKFAYKSDKYAISPSYITGTLKQDSSPLFIRVQANSIEKPNGNTITGTAKIAYFLGNHARARGADTTGILATSFFDWQRQARNKAKPGEVAMANLITAGWGNS